MASQRGGRPLVARHADRRRGTSDVGNTVFVLSEVYETEAGVAEHWRQAIETWDDLPAFMDRSGRVRVGTLHSGEVVQGLW